MNLITIFHYHLLPGGVTNVILQGASALIPHLPEIGRIRLVCGSAENTEQIKQQLEVEIIVDPGIGYADRNTPIEQDEIARFSKQLIDKYGGGLWWIHNYQLGKNPLFTAAIVHIAENHKQQKLLLQIHDFPECARYSNLEKLNQAGISNPYPVSESTYYSLINERDRRILTEAGIPPDRAILLNNPVEDKPAKSVRPDKTKLTKMFSSYKDSFPALKVEGKTLFYPVRTIRRKNVLEAGLITAVSEQPLNLIVSLPGVSGQEQKYSDLCEECFRSGLIPGVWGTGVGDSRDVPTYPEMLQLSDLIISTSVQEGFGYLFINSVQLGIPLFARYLDILEGVGSVLDNPGTHFYRSYSVPAGRALKDKLGTEYGQKLKKISGYIPRESYERIASEVEKIEESGSVDFSFLSVDDQVECLKTVQESADYRSSVHELNSDKMKNLYTLLENGPYEPVAAGERFSLKSHAQTIGEIIRQMEIRPDTDTTSPPKQTERPEIQQRLLDRFAELEYMRLLYDY